MESTDQCQNNTPIHNMDDLFSSPITLIPREKYDQCSVVNNDTIQQKTTLLSEVNNLK